MNYRGSYRYLLRNAQAAMLAAIEIYNKPRFDYREECCVILLLNAWELLLKALLSKNKRSIFYPKRRKEPYRTLAWSDALAQAERFFPPQISPLPVRRNLEMVATYRDNAVHFYNAKGFATVLYALAQTSIVNFRDVLLHAFKVDLSQEISWQLLPLGLRVPIDPIEYISGKSVESKKGSAAVRQFLSELAAATKEVEAKGDDTGRLLTIFSVKLESTKKISDADVVVGVTKATETPGPLAIVRAVDPNLSHPLRQTEVLAKVPTLHGKPFSAHTFQALVWKHDLKGRPEYCWKAKEGVLTRYSSDIVAWINQRTPQELESALGDYRAFLRGMTGTCPTSSHTPA